MPETPSEARGAVDVVQQVPNDETTTLRLDEDNREWLREVANYCDERVDPLDVSSNDVLTGVRHILNELDPDDDLRFHMDDENLEAFLLTILEATRRYQWETYGEGVPGEGPSAGGE